MVRREGKRYWQQSCSKKQSCTVFSTGWCGNWHYSCPQIAPWSPTDSRSSREGMLRALSLWNKHLVENNMDDGAVRCFIR